MPAKKYQGALTPFQAFNMSRDELLAARKAGWYPPMAGGATEFITPSTVARRGLATLYNTTILAGLVSRDYDDAFNGKVGDTITIRKPAIFTANLFNRATGIVLQDPDEDSMPVKLDKIADVSFPVTTEDLTLKIDDFAGRLLNPAMEAIVQSIDLALAVALLDAADDPGAGGVAVMDAKASDVLAESREKLTRKKLPLTERYAVLSPESVTVALSDINFINAEKSGSTDALREASLGRVFGQDTYESQVFGAGPGPAGQADGVAFHRSAVTLASRTLQAPNGVAPNMYAIESYRGLSIRVVYAYDVKFKQDVVSCDFLYGTAKTRPEGAVKLDLGRGS
jgi:P22 coat protein - gene protein 5